MEPIERVRRYSFLKVDDDKLNEIVAMGFDKSEAENALLNKVLFFAFIHIYSLDSLFSLCILM